MTESTRPPHASPLAGIRAVTFDVGGTLIKPQPSVGHIYAQIAARRGVTGLDPDVLNQRFKAAWRAQPDFRHSREEWASLVDKSFEGFCEPPPSRSFFDELYEHFTKPDAWHVYDDGQLVLSELKSRNLPLAVISNWDDRLHPLLENLKLRPFFDSVIVSCDVGVSKPHPLIFERAVAALGAAPAEILHIGDEPKADYAGARRAGLRTLLLCRDGVRSAPGTIASLREIL